MEMYNLDVTLQRAIDDSNLRYVFTSEDNNLVPSTFTYLCLIASPPALALPWSFFRLFNFVSLLRAFPSVSTLSLAIPSQS